jgi:putative tryptophan/tyrosine transport system substrate-binding protein
MNRRELLVLLGSMMIAARAPRAQQKVMPVIGFLGAGSAGPLFTVVGAFRQGLNETGYVEGQNVAIEYRWAEGRYDRLPALAADLVGRKVDVIAALGGTSPALAAKSATATIPIVFSVGDPVERGLVASLARPGGNLTGVSSLDLAPKRVEMLSELVPRATLIAVLVNPDNANAERIVRDVQEAARAKGLQLLTLKASTESEIDTAFATLVELNAGALVLPSDAYLNSRREQLVALTARHAVPAIYDWREYPAAGGLISYGPSLTAAYRLVGVYAGKILKGAKPADLPVQQPTTFELVVNLKTAKELGLTVPPSILSRADEVIE